MTPWNRLLRAAEALVPGVVVDPGLGAAFSSVRRGGREAVLHPTDEPRVVFVARGLVRFYALDEGAEHNQFFGVAGDFVHAFLAEREGLPYGAEALEASEGLTVPSAVWVARGGALVPAVQGRMLEHKARHSRILQHRDTVERIAALRAWKPEWWVRVPQYHLANYLGVSEVTLSRALGRGPA